MRNAWITIPRCETNRKAYITFDASSRPSSGTTCGGGVTVARNASANTVKTYGVQRPSLIQPKNANTFRYSFDRPSLYSASEQAMNNVAIGLSGTTGHATMGSSRNCGM